MIYTFIARRCADLPVATACRVMKVSTSGFYAWRKCPVTDREWDDAVFTNTIVDIHRMSRRSYGSPRVHAELVLGLATPCSRSRVERLMRQARVQGIYRRRGQLQGCTRRSSKRSRGRVGAFRQGPRRPSRNGAPERLPGLPLGLAVLDSTVVLLGLTTIRAAEQCANLAQTSTRDGNRAGPPPPILTVH